MLNDNKLLQYALMTAVIPVACFFYSYTFPNLSLLLLLSMTLVTRLVTIAPGDSRPVAHARPLPVGLNISFFPLSFYSAWVNDLKQRFHVLALPLAKFAATHRHCQILPQLVHISGNNSQLKLTQQYSQSNQQQRIKGPGKTIRDSNIWQFYRQSTA